jgi:hypothetical protein
MNQYEIRPHLGSEVVGRSIVDVDKNVIECEPYRHLSDTENTIVSVTNSDGDQVDAYACDLLAAMQLAGMDVRWIRD